MSKCNDGFCPLPFNSISAKSNGDIRLCCNTDYLSRDRAVFYKNSEEIYNSSKDDWNEVRNCEQLKDIRKTMLKGEWHPDCIKCKVDESHGMRTLRMQEQDRWKMTIEDAKSITAEDGTVDTEKLPLQYIDIRYGNFCNLKCRMCAPTDSSKWYDDFVELTGKSEFKDGHKSVILKASPKGTWETSEYDWISNSEVFESNISKYATTAKLLYILGGEPLIIPEHIAHLKQIIAAGNSNKIEIRYASNLTSLPDQLIELWSRFKKITIFASIDGYGSVFNYQRTPANWETVYKNMQIIDKIPFVNAYSQYTTTVLNVFHFPEFYKWWKFESGLNKFTPINTNCHTPNIYNIKILPPDIKLQIEEYYNSFSIDDRFEERKNIVLDFMNSEDKSNMLEKFIHSTKKLDVIRSQDITNIVPQFKGLFI